VEQINRWLTRVKIAHKLILSSVVFALPIAVLLYYVTTGYNRGIRTCEREVAGTAALEICPALLHDLRGLESRAPDSPRARRCRDGPVGRLSDGRRSAGASLQW